MGRDRRPGRSGRTAPRRGEGGWSLIEVVVVVGASLACTYCLLIALRAGSRSASAAYQGQSASQAEAAILTGLARELASADPSTIVHSSAAPGQILFQQVVGYDAATGTRILSAPMTLRTAAIAGSSDLAVEVVEVSGTTRLGSHVLASDPDASGQTGLQFDVRTTSAGTAIDITLKVRGVDGAPRVVSTSVVTRNE